MVQAQVLRLEESRCAPVMEKPSEEGHSRQNQHRTMTMMTLAKERNLYYLVIKSYLIIKSHMDHSARQASNFSITGFIFPMASCAFARI
jgi:hypothetical protein